MKALVLEIADGPQSVHLRDVERPEPRAGEVRVALKAASLNHRELWITRGQYPGMQLPCTLGCDGAGVIDAVGEGVEQTRLGQAVVLYPGLNWGPHPMLPAAEFGLLGMPGPGTLAEAICLPATHVAPMPVGLSFEQAAAVPLGALTAWRGLTVKGGLRAGESVLITGIGGGVASFALMIAVALGAKAYVTSSSRETLERAAALGAAGGFDYKDPDWRKAVGKTTGGLDVVFDGAPASSYANYSRALKMGARVVVYGSTGGMQFPVNAPEIFLKNVSIVGSNVGSLDEFKAVLTFFEQHRMQPVIDRQFSLDEAGAALTYLESSHQFGKVVVRIAS
jgi:zinc-binding alcohol dehydrogenase/oxidoreductase